MHNFNKKQARNFVTQANEKLAPFGISFGFIDQGRRKIPYIVTIKTIRVNGYAPFLIEQYTKNVFGGKQALDNFVNLFQDQEKELSGEPYWNPPAAKIHWIENIYPVLLELLEQAEQ